MHGQDEEPLLFLMPSHFLPIDEFTVFFLSSLMKITEYYHIQPPIYQWLRILLTYL
jgi:hypothetical protein